MTTMYKDDGSALHVEYHWGKYVFSDTPVTGVISCHSVEWIHDECNYHGVANLSYDGALEYFLNEKRAEWEVDNEGDPDEDTIEEWTYEFNDFYESQGDTILIGDWQQDNDGLWGPIERGNKGYAAIVNYDSNTIQVVWSEFVTMGALCSPCYPGQVDLDTEGDYMGYDLPIDLYGEVRENTNPQMPNPMVHSHG